jgi:hypothetical protein
MSAPWLYESYKSAPWLYESYNHGSLATFHKKYKLPILFKTKYTKIFHIGILISITRT